MNLNNNSRALELSERDIIRQRQQQQIEFRDNEGDERNMDPGRAIVVIGDGFNPVPGGSRMPSRIARSADTHSTHKACMTSPLSSRGFSVAPSLSKPIAPFAKSERKRAYTSAVYYSECCIRGIKPLEADIAAFDVQNKYTKWWIGSRYKYQQEKDETSHDKPTLHVVQNSGLSSDLAGIGNEYDGSKYFSPSRKRKRLGHGNDCNSIGEYHLPAPRAIPGTTQSMLVSATTLPQVQRSFVATFNKDLQAESNAPAAEVADSVPAAAVSEEETSRKHSPLYRSYTQVQEEIVHNICDISGPPTQLIHVEVNTLKSKLIANLKATGGDTSHAEFQSYLEHLSSIYTTGGWDARPLARRKNADINGTLATHPLEGSWLTLSKPTFTECLGRNDKGEYIYTLGRMSFDMFRPAQLKCSVRGIYNKVRLMDISNGSRPKSFPRKLAKVINMKREGGPEVLHYDIVVSFTVEAGQTRKGTKPENVENCTSSNSDFVVQKSIGGSLTNYGYIVADPDVPNRLTVWFSAGKIEVNSDSENSSSVHHETSLNLQAWKELFDVNAMSLRGDMRNEIRTMAHILAAKIMLGAHISDKMKDDGSFSYLLKRPIGGHGQVFCDILYMDETLRIMKGHNGTIFVLSRMPQPEADTEVEAEQDCLWNDNIN